MLALGAGLFTWALTALGATVVFGRKQPGSVWLDGSLGFAGGVMIAASFWSLLEPAVELSTQLGMPRWLPATVGCVLGAASIRLVDLLLPHLHPGLQTPEGIKTDWHRALLLVLAITLHNIPEGLAVGVAFGAAAIMDTSSSALLGAAVALAIGIGLQNFPEGIAVSMPLRRMGVGRARSFYYGQLSAIVEPVAGVVGALAVLWLQPILPFALAFAAGAMIYVVVEEVIPETQQDKNTDIATLGFIGGFIVMMVLDVALG